MHGSSSRDKPQPTTTTTSMSSVSESSSSSLTFRGRKRSRSHSTTTCQVKMICRSSSHDQNESRKVAIEGGNRLTAIHDAARQRLTWSRSGSPKSVLVIKKIRDTSVIPPFLDLIRWLIYDRRLTVFVEPAAFQDLALVRAEQSVSASLLEKLSTFHADSTDKIDLIICLGGDGTLLYASSLFQRNVPPVMAFHLGSLGFLTPFEFDLNYQEQVSNVLSGHSSLTLRSRLRCLITKKNSDRLVHGVAIKRSDINGSPSKGTSGTSCHLVLNEVVVDRGPHPYLSNIELFIDGKYITTVQGDGLIVSTPTGSTAYAVAAGASMIHPSVPAIMVTPICPHSLSFRPIVVPAGVELKICVADDSRNSAWVSFDGRKRQELLTGDCLRVTTSIYPVPSICSEDQISDWFDSLAECLHWNVRKKQRGLDDFPTDFTPSAEGSTAATLSFDAQPLTDVTPCLSSISSMSSSESA